MRKFLSIVIPRYQETEKQVFALLSSINNQVGIDMDDLEVIISSDGGHPGLLSDDFLKIFDYDIKQIELKENRGPGVARQHGLDNATGQYVMFCDADDCLHNVGVLGALIQDAEKNAPDIVRTSWLEEYRNKDGGYIYINHKRENTWMHGKIFRRQFLINNNIRFHDDLRVHEDSYFLSIAMAVAEKANYIDFISYVWKYQSDSITRRNDGLYTFNSSREFIRACCLGFKEIERINPSLMQYKIVQFTLYNYFCYHRPMWLEESRSQYLDEAETSFSEFIKPFWRYWVEAPNDFISKIYNEERQNNFANCIENETLDAWLRRIKV